LPRKDSHGDVLDGKRFFEEKNHEEKLAAKTSRIIRENLTTVKSSFVQGRLFLINNRLLPVINKK